MDGRLCLWDSRSQGNIRAPISTLISREDFPIYAVDIGTPSNQQDGCGEGSMVSRVAVGGGRDGGFLGVPVYLYDVPQEYEDKLPSQGQKGAD